MQGTAQHSTAKQVLVLTRLALPHHSLPAVIVVMVIDKVWFKFKFICYSLSRGGSFFPRGESVAWSLDSPTVFTVLKCVTKNE